MSPGFVNALASGPTSRRRTSGRKRQPQFVSANGRIGQVFVVKGVGGGDQPYVLMADGYAPISPLQAALIQNSASYRLPKDAPLDGAAVTTHRSNQRVIDEGCPSRRSRSGRTTRRSLCVVYPTAGKGSKDARLTVGGGTDLPMPRARPGRASTTWCSRRAARSRRKRAAASGSVDAINTYALVADDGRRYALKSAETAKALGYTISADGSDAVPVPANLLNLVPKGPVLDPQQALQPIQQGGAGS